MGVRACARCQKHDVSEGFGAVSTLGVCGSDILCWKTRSGHSLDPTVKPIDGAGATRCEGGGGGGGSRIARDAPGKEGRVPVTGWRNIRG